MTNTLKSLLSDSPWLVEEKYFDKHQLNAFETIFTIGNGYLGTRGSLEEGHQAGLPGTYINGIFDDFDSFVVDMVNAPDWAAFSVWVEGEKLSLHTCEVLEYYRALDMKQGILYRKTRFKDRKGRITDFESIRYANFYVKNQFEVKVNITPKNYSGRVMVEAPIDGHVFNLDLEPAYKEKPDFIPEVQWDKWTKSKHLSFLDSGETKSGVFLQMKTLERPYHLIYNSSLTLKNKDIPTSNQFDFEKINQTITFDASEGKTYNFEKVITIFTSREVKESHLKISAERLLKDSLGLGFEERLKQHKHVWEDKWRDSNVEIEGDSKANNAMKFNIYHLLICANEQDDKANVGAKSLSGEGYKGHVFWDTEIFLLPFYIYTQPDTAKALIMYRYHTMQDAKQYALESGYKGARFAWEATDRGFEATPPWTADGVNRIWCGERELHVTSAVVYGVLSYYQATEDIDFFLNYGLEILFETSRFWDSRLEYNKKENRYELNNVEGPDEFHELVNNNVYTNWLTKWSLEQSYAFYNEFQHTYSKELQRLVSKMGITREEVEDWENKASKIYIPFDEKKKLVEEFEGYFKLKEEPITIWDENGMPVYPKGYNHFNSQETTLIKQPDVLMLMYLLPDEFTSEIKKINYDYYEKRTMHKSSLSPSIHTIMGIETRNYERAVQYFNRAAFVDLVDNQGNTSFGAHIASSGGTWQAAINGFGGMRIKNGLLTFKPWLPEAWKSIRFKIKWRSDEIEVKIREKEINFTLHSRLEKNLTIKVLDNKINLTPNRTITIAYEAYE